MHLWHTSVIFKLLSIIHTLVYFIAASVFPCDLHIIA